MITIYHCTTPAKIERYKITGAILPPVRGFSTLYAAKRWCKRTQRSIILSINANIAYPLPDHKPGGAMWTNEIIRDWKEQP